MRRCLFRVMCRSMAELELLVQAGASVNMKRTDGVGAVWLAAQVW